MSGGFSFSNPLRRIKHFSREGRKSGQTWDAPYNQALNNIPTNEPFQIPPIPTSPPAFSGNPQTDASRDPQQLVDDLNRGRSVASTPQPGVAVGGRIVDRPRPKDPSLSYSFELPAESHLAQTPPVPYPDSARNDHFGSPGGLGNKVTPLDPGKTWQPTTPVWYPSSDAPPRAVSSPPPADFPQHSAAQTGESGGVGDGVSVLSDNETASRSTPQPNNHTPPPQVQGRAQDQGTGSLTPATDPRLHESMAPSKQTPADTARIAAKASWPSTKASQADNRSLSRKAVAPSPANRPQQQDAARLQSYERTPQPVPNVNERSQYREGSDDEGDEEVNGTANLTPTPQAPEQGQPTYVAYSPNAPNSVSQIQQSDPANPADADNTSKWHGLGQIRNKITRPAKEAPFREPVSESEHEKRTEKRAKEALKPFKVDKTPGLTHMDTLLSWFPRELEKREDACKQAKLDLSGSRKEVKQLEKTVNALERENADLQGLRLEISEQKGQMQKLQQSLAKARVDRDGWRQAHDAATKDLAVAQQDAARAMGDVTQLKSQLQASMGEAQQYMERNRGLDTENGKLSTRLRSVEAENAGWANKLASETQRLQQEKLDETRRLEQENRELSRRWEHEILQETQRLEKEKAEVSRRLEKEKLQATRRLEREKQEETGQLRQELQAVERESELKVASIQATLDEDKEQHHREKIRWEQSYAKLEESVGARIARETRHLSSKVTSLNNAIAAHSKDNWRPIPDDQFQISFQKLAQKVSNLVGYVPKPATPALNGGGIQQYDNNGYFARSSQGASGSRAWPRFVKSLCWSVYYRGFFQLQPGFGILGSTGEGYHFMQGMYELLTVEPAPDAPDGSAPVLRNDKETNSWRASAFDLILKAVQNSDGAEQEKRVVYLFNANVRRVADELTDALQKVSGGRLDPGGQAQIQDTSRELGILALKMGSQRAQLMLGLATQGQRTRGGMLGNKFKDEAGSGNGTSVIEATTQPCFWKLGDGSGNATTETVFVVGQVVSS